MTYCRPISPCDTEISSSSSSSSFICSKHN